MAETEKSGKVEVMFVDGVTYDGMPYTKGKTVQLNRTDADNLILSGHAVEYNEAYKATEEKRKELPQNKPLKERDVVIATHDSGEQVAYPDSREKGPLDIHPTPGSAWSMDETRKAGGSVDAQRMANERNKKLKSGRQVEELPVGDIPTAVPLGAHEAAQAATKSLKANVPPAGGVEIDSKEAAKAAKATAEDEKKKAK